MRNSRFKVDILKNIKYQSFNEVNKPIEKVKGNQSLDNLTVQSHYLTFSIHYTDTNSSL